MTPRHAIIGTAGHIDHGKTELVRMLTGQDTDRLKEEKERGISIELGFAHYEIDGHRFGVVDVPGHERFIRQMLAGAHGIDLVLLVIAADDGIMPQTEEHFDILHLLGVKRGIFVITKADLVAESRLLEVRSDIEVLACDTPCEAWPVSAVSSTTGQGIAELRERIAQELASLPAREPRGWFRLPIDRAFSLHGHGLVVTGTAAAGVVHEGDTLAIRPGELTSRARSLQVHGEPVQEACVGQRVAVNLSGIEKDQAARGHWLTDPRVECTTDRVDCWLEVRPGARRPLRSFDRVRVYLGTAEIMGRVILFGERRELEPRSSGFCQLALESPVIASLGDRFVIRTEEASRTTGGGEILHPLATRHRATEPDLEIRLRRLRSNELAVQVHAFLDLLRELAASPDLIAQSLACGAEEVAGAAAGSPDIVALTDAAELQALTTRGKWESVAAMVTDTLTDFHRSQPIAPGMDLESLRTRLRMPMPAKLFRPVVARLEASGLVVREEASIRLAGHRVTLDHAGEDRLEALTQALQAGELTPPDVKQLSATLGLSESRLLELLRVLEKEGRVVRVAPDLYYLGPALERARGILVERLREASEITVADYRTLLSASRKYALALLEYFDRSGVTLRIGDLRRLRAGGPVR